MTNIPETVTTEWLFSGVVGQVTTIHLNMETHHTTCRDLVVRETGERLGMGIANISPKPRGRKKGMKNRRDWFVDGIDEPFNSADDALVVYNRRRRAKATDAEWDAAGADQQSER